MTRIAKVSDPRAVESERVDCVPSVERELRPQGSRFRVDLEQPSAWALAPRGTDALEAIDNGLAAVEVQGLIPNGVASGPAIGTALRKEYRAIGAPPDTSPSGTIYGLEVAVTPIWNATVGDAIVGDWSKLVIGAREDIRFETSDSAVLN
ncbi:MAG TPA: hypothetical protein VFH69_01630 [Gemmatimonadota bacterium]|nr:hypothetical protein [Gemmatimonadota bacterium]